MRLVATLQPTDQEGLCRGGEEDQRADCADYAVEVDAGPDGHRVAEAEDHEGEDGEGEC